jgi:hypothetical protein
MTATLFEEQPMATAEPTTELVTVQANPLELWHSLVSQGMDPDKLQGLLALTVQWEDRQSEKAYSLAMKAAQDEIKQLHVKPDRKNTHTGSWYAQLERISHQIDPVINRHGFSLSYDTEEHPKPEKLWIVCDCRHDGGHLHRYRIPLDLDDKGAKGTTNKTAVQACGSTVTYGRRYLKCMIFDVVVEGMDNDGNDEPGDPITEEQIAALNEWMETASEPLANVLKFGKVDSLKDFPGSKVQTVIDALKKRCQR